MGDGKKSPGRCFYTAIAVLLCALSVPGAASAHGMRSAYLEIREQVPNGDGSAEALVVFRLAVDAPLVAPHLPSFCQLTPLSQAVPTDSGRRYSFRAHCTKPWSGATVGVDNLGPLVGEAVVWVTLQDGRSLSQLLTARAPLWTIPERSSFLRTAQRYVALGMRHIAEGTDHLLFLLLLVLTVQKPRAVLIAESAFTLSHSLTFSANALGWLHVAPAAAEACIALSLVLLALDVGRSGVPPMSAWRGGALALGFGAVHGLGFAAGLREAGLPAEHVGAALCGFGLGVELAQLGFVLVVLCGVLLLSRSRWQAPIAVATAYGAGAIATVWLLERLGLCFHLFPTSLR
jgi:hypothetical protein